MLQVGATGINQPTKEPFLTWNRPEDLVSTNEEDKEQQ
jgi:hypothetical protein